MAEIDRKNLAEKFHQERNIKSDKIFRRDTYKDGASVFVVNKKVKRNTAKKIKKDLIYENESYKKKTFGHRIRTLVFLLFIALFAGSGLGLWYYNTMLRSDTDWETLFTQADTYMPDYNQTFTNNFSFGTPTNKSWVQLAKSQNKTPASLSAVDNFILAEWNAIHSSSYSAVSTGKVLTLGINQMVSSTKKYDGNAYTFEALSNGVVSVASLDYYQKNSMTAKIYTGSTNKNGETKWNLDREIPYNEYCDLIGTSITNVHPYIISSKTVKNASEVKQDETTGNYNFSLILDETLGALKYTKQVKKTGGLSSYPEFVYINLNITIDKDWNLVAIEAKEYYTAIAYGMKISCDAHMYYNYNFDGIVTLPV